MDWVHNACAGEDSQYVGAWTCSKCRSLPAQLVKLESQISNLTSIVNLLHTDRPSHADIQRTQSDNNRLAQKIAHLEARNAELQKLIHTMSDSSSSSSPPSSSTTTIDNYWIRSTSCRALATRTKTKNVPRTRGNQLFHPFRFVRSGTASHQLTPRRWRG